jgi:carbon monoxide dehydrogenase subunit G
MQLHNEFIVSTDPQSAWRQLTDLEYVATCLPGAKLLGVDGEQYRGQVQVKVGPIRAAFEGTAHFEQRDDEQLRAVIVAAGRDPRGQAAADARITAQVVPDGQQSRVVVDTDLNISGRLAQFGRGAVADVSARLMTQFADNLDAKMSGQGPAGAAATPAVPPRDAPGAAPTTPLTSSAQPSAPTQPTVTSAPSAASLNAAELIGPVVLRRYGPYLAVALGAALLTRAFCGRRRPVRSCACR